MSLGTLGTIKHSRRKTKGASWRHEGPRGPAWPESHRGLTVKVKVKRGPSQQGGFYAQACVVGRKSYKHPRPRCSTWVFGGGPTKAVKRALSELSKGLR